MEAQVTTASNPPGIRRLSAMVDGAVRHWLAVANVLLGAFVLAPWLAPVFMELGWQGAGRAVYTIYSFMCHQLPQRSWFLFGSHFTLPLDEIRRIGGLPNDVFALRTFIGNSEVGWKVGWSDRMVTFYGGWFLFGLVYALLRNRTRGLTWKTALALFLPMVVDGLSHMISDLWGMGAGFRETNAWLAFVTGGLLPTSFYAGDGWGSFNSLMRLGTGLLAAFAVIFFVFPLIDRSMRAARGRNAV